MGDEATTNEIVDGDIHTVLWDLNPDMFTTRGVAKSPTYALLYGSGDDNLGSLADVPHCRDVFASVEKMHLRGWAQDGAGMWRHSRWNPKKESLTFKAAQDTVLGGIIRKRIMEGLQPLGQCVERITKQAEKGFLVGLDGRKLIVRSTHSALNLKLQSTGAIICKTALVLAMEKLEEQGLVVLGDGYKANTFVELFTFYHK